MNTSNEINTKTTDSLWLYALLSLMATAGFFYVNIMGAIVEGLVTGLKFSNAQAGMVGSANIYGAAVGTMIAIFIVRHIRWKPALASLLFILLAIDLFSITIQEPILLTIIRACHGFVGGMAVGVTYSVMARTQSPDRAFGMLLLLQFSLGGFGLMFLPALVPLYGAKILFMVLAALTSIALLGMLLLPRSIVHDVVDNTKLLLQVKINKLTASFTLLALFLFQAGNMALASFIIRLGENYKLTLDIISEALGWATWIGALGAVAVIMIGIRYGRMRLLLISMLLTLIGIAGFYWSDNVIIFFAANIGTAITWSFVVPYLFGMASELDKSGRLATTAGFASKLGLASGTIAAGLILQTDDYEMLISMSLVLLAIATVCAVIAAIKVDTKVQTETN